MPNPYFAPFSWVVLISVLLTQLHADENAQWGELTYPLFGNIRAEKGTLLVRFQIDEPIPSIPGTWQQPQDHFSRFSLASIETNPQNKLTIYRRKNGKSGAMWTSMGLQAFPPGSPNLNSGGENWKMGEAHYIAYSWDAEGRHKWWVDGELIKTAQAVGLETGVGTPQPSSGMLTLGSTSSASASAITLLGVHILDQAVTEEDFTGSIHDLFSPRPDTLLLDIFNGSPFLPDGSKETTAAVITGYNGERGGIPSHACQFVQTSYGSGLRLYTPPSHAEARED